MEAIVDEGISGDGSLAHDRWIAGSSGSWWENTNWFRVQRPAPAVEYSIAAALSETQAKSSLSTPQSAAVNKYQRFPSVQKSSTSNISSNASTVAESGTPIDLNADAPVEDRGVDSSGATSAGWWAQRQNQQVPVELIGSAAAKDASHGAGGANCFNRFRPRIPIAQRTESATETVETHSTPTAPASISATLSSSRSSGDAVKQFVTRSAERARLRIRCLQGFDSSVVSKINQYIILPLFHRKIFSSLGVKAGKGVVLSGSVGSGKSWLLSALVNELGVYYHRVDCAALAVQMEQEKAAGKMEDDQDNTLSSLFKSCTKHAPAVLLLEDFDVIGHQPAANENPSTTRIRSLLRTHMDRLSKSTSAVCVVATAASAGLLCPSLRRAGRFDREIALTKPDASTRHDLLKEMTKDMKVAEDVNIKEVAQKAHGYVAADLAMLVTEAGMAAIREFVKAHIEEPLAAVNTFEIPLHIAEESISSARVWHRHFEFALEKCRPNILRGDDANIPKVTWSDVGGQESLKALLQESIKWPLQYPHIFRAFHLSPSTGILLYGPPGTGKTLIAQAVANEMQINFLSVKGPELLSSYVGESEANIRALFAKARASAPCVVFFDEIDSIARSRAFGQHNSDQTADRILNQLLTELDTQITLTGGDNTPHENGGEDQKVNEKSGVTQISKNRISSRDDQPLLFFIAATNRPDVLDSALIRPGRVDNLVYVGLPNVHERLLVLKACLRNTPIHSSVIDNDFSFLKELSLKTNLFSQADLSALVRTATKLTVRQHILSVESDAKKEEQLAFQQHLVTPEQFLVALKTCRPSVRPDELSRFAAFQASFQGPAPPLEQPNGLTHNQFNDWQMNTAVKETAENSKTVSGEGWRERVRKEIQLETEEEKRKDAEERKPTD